jgi:hypothetical protein
LFDDLAHFVAVTGPELDERQDQQLRAALFELAVQDARMHMLHSYILLKGI